MGPVSTVRPENQLAVKFDQKLDLRLTDTSLRDG